MPVTGPGKVSYFLVFAVIGLLAAIAGFAKTFFMPMAAGSFKAPVGIHIHGALAFTWIILFLVQTFAKSCVSTNPFSALSLSAFFLF